MPLLGFFNLNPMATYRSVSTSIWSDDAIIGLSPEQKLLFLYLHTNPYANACGIYKMQPRTMGFHLGLTADPFESALRGLCAAMPDFVAVDWETNEVALLQYPRQTLITASKKMMGHVTTMIKDVESQFLLKQLIAKNSATLSAPYLSHLRRLLVGNINDAKNHVDVLQLSEDHEDVWKRKPKHKTKTHTHYLDAEVCVCEDDFSCIDLGGGTPIEPSKKDDYNEYKSKVKMRYPALYNSGCKILLDVQYFKAKELASQLSEQDSSAFIGLVWQAHELLNSDQKRRASTQSVSELANKLLLSSQLQAIY